jgi:hypothetical protein
MSVIDALDQYASNVNNTFPKKHHLAEFNPSIAKLPNSYLTNKAWLATFGGNESHGMPVYIASFRVSNHNECFLAEQLKSVKFNNDYPAWQNSKPKTEFIGFALLNNNLEIVADITVDLGWDGTFKREFQDYRVFNLRGGDGENEQLYLSTYTLTAPIQLRLSEGHDPQESNKSTSNGYKRLLPPGMFRSDSNQQHPKFEVWYRDFPSCVSPHSRLSHDKNLLYFDEIVTAAMKNSTDIGTRTNVLFRPCPPNDVILADLNKMCIAGNVSRPSYMKDLWSDPPPNPIGSFRTMEQEIFPTHAWQKQFTSDRGSACCIRVPKDQIPIAPSMTGHVNNETSRHDGDNTLMIAVVHLKTKGDPIGVPKRMYLSRFIAFLPHEPYTIVARSGLFCLGFHTGDVNALVNPLFHKNFIQQNALKLGPETLASCPRIHFVMSMIEKNPTKNNQRQAINDHQQESVIMSYGVQDCYSRIVEVKKSDIINMFKGNYLSG